MNIEHISSILQAQAMLSHHIANQDTVLESTENQTVQQARQIPSLISIIFEVTDSHQDNLP